MEDAPTTTREHEGFKGPGEGRKKKVEEKGEET
jgi:hypothetical protein